MLIVIYWLWVALVLLLTHAHVFWWKHIVWPPFCSLFLSSCNRCHRWNWTCLRRRGALSAVKVIVKAMTFSILLLQWQLASKGLNVVLISRSPFKLQNVAAEIGKPYNIRLPESQFLTYHFFFFFLGIYFKNQITKSRHESSTLISPLAPRFTSGSARSWRASKSVSWSTTSGCLTLILNILLR